MKVINTILMFLLAVFSYLCLMDLQTNEVTTISNKNVQYNAAADTAIDAAVSGTVESVNSASEIATNMDACINRFYRSLFASLGAIDNEVLQQDLQIYTPVLCLADVDGFYVIYNSVNKDGKLEKIKTPKIPYVLTFSKDRNGNELHYTVNATLGDDVTVTFRGDNKVYSGNFKELKEKYPGTMIAQKWEDTVFAEKGTYNNWKDHVIAETICEQLNHYAQLNNVIASDFGIKYNFVLPETAATELANGMSNVTFMALFQGMPYGAGTKSVYNKFCVSGAHVNKMKVYYVRPFDDGNGVHYYYHKPDCKELFDSSLDADGFYSTDSGLGYAFSTAQQAAESGALPCPHCCY